MICDQNGCHEESGTAKEMQTWQCWYCKGWYPAGGVHQCTPSITYTGYVSPPAASEETLGKILELLKEIRMILRRRELRC